MRICLIMIFTLLVFENVQGQRIRLIDVYDNYMSKENLYMQVIAISSSTSKLEHWKSEYHLYMNRNEKKDFDLVYYEWPMNSVLLKSLNNPICVKVQYRGSDSTVCYDFTSEEVQGCVQITGVDLNPLENPFSDCFYFRNHLLNSTKMKDLKYSYYVSIGQNSSYGIGKRIWVNKSNLLIDSVKYLFFSEFDTLTRSLYFEYPSQGNNYLINQKFKLHQIFDSLSAIVKSKPAFPKVPVDSAAIKFEKLTLLDFWSIGCQPCIAGFSKLQNLRDSFPVDFLEIKALNNIDSRKNIEFFRSRNKFTFDMQQDSLNITTFLGISMMPTLVLIGADGKELFRLEGTDPVKFEAMKVMIKEMYNIQK